MDHFEENGIQDYVQIGEGSFGKVFRGVYQNRNVAIKVCNSSLETSILSQINHPNIIKLYKGFYFGQDSFYMMEYCEGGTLRDYISNQLSEQEIIQIMRGLLGAVEYLHSQGIIHRDIKPENILMKETNNFKTIKLADFGLSFQYNADIQYYQTVNVQCGTYIYMAPEQIQGQTYNKTVDIWACGIILYMLFCGKHPFYPLLSTKKDFIEKLNSTPYELPSKVSSLSRDLLKRLLCIDSHKRYTASQALSHPWLTGRHQDTIPMSIIEFAKCKEKTDDFNKYIKILMFLHYFGQICENKVEQQSNQESRQVSPISINNVINKKQQLILKPIILKNNIRLNKQDESTKRIRLSQITALMTYKLDETSIKIQEIQKYQQQQQQQIRKNQIKICSQPSLDSPKKKQHIKQQYSVDCKIDENNEIGNSVSPIKVDIESSQKFQNQYSFSKLILPQLSDSTQASISPEKKQSKSILLRKSQSTMQIGVQKIKNQEINEQKTTVRQRIETIDHKNYQSSRVTIKANSTGTLCISPKHKLIQQIIQQQQQLLFPKYRKRL